MNFLKGILLTLGPRLLGTVASAIAGYVVVKSKGIVQIDGPTLVEVGTAMIGAYAATHRGATAVSPNQADAATVRVAEGINAAANDEAVDTTVRIPDR
jgi:hypothetical protein